MALEAENPRLMCQLIQLPGEGSLFGLEMVASSHDGEKSSGLSSNSFSLLFVLLRHNQQLKTKLVALVVKD